MNKKTWMIILLVTFSLLLAACGGGEEADTTENTAAETSSNGGDAAHGEELYKQTVIGDNSAPGCSTCHSLDEGVTLVGPSHAKIGTTAGSTVEGQSAEDYLHESIVNPDAHVTEGFTAGIMYQNYSEDLSESDINDLVAFLLTQK